MFKNRPYFPFRRTWPTRSAWLGSAASANAGDPLALAADDFLVQCAEDIVAACAALSSLFRTKYY